MFFRFGVVTEKKYEEEEEVVTHSGYLLKIATNTKLKKVYFKLVGKDLYCKYTILINY